MPFIKGILGNYYNGELRKTPVSVKLLVVHFEDKSKHKEDFEKEAIFLT